MDFTKYNTAKAQSVIRAAQRPLSLSCAQGGAAGRSGAYVGVKFAFIGKNEAVQIHGTPDEMQAVGEAILAAVRQSRESVARLQVESAPGQEPAPLAALRHHVSGAIARGEGVAIVEKAPAPSATETAVRAAQVAAGDGEDWEYGAPAVMQRLLDSGAVWSLEGSAGRAAMAALESGACFLPLVPGRDFWGNRIPARGDLKAGTKGTLENSARFYSI